MTASVPRPAGQPNWAGRLWWLTAGRYGRDDQALALQSRPCR